jgi:hypothetical protein
VPKIGAVRKTSASAYGGSTSTRAAGEGGESLPLYEFILENPDNTVGFAVVSDASVFDQVIAYAPKGSMSDTVYNKALAMYFRELAMLDKAISEEQRDRQPATRADVWQSGWESVISEYVGDWEIIGIYEPEYYNEYIKPAGAGYSWYNPVHMTNTSSAYVSVQWGQLNPYSNDTPYIYTGRDPQYQQYRNIEHVSAGCFATALGQVMAHHRYPTTYNWNLITQTATIPKTPYRYSGNVNLGVDFSKETPAQKEVSRLLYDIGRGRTQYSPDNMVSGTYTDNYCIPALNAFGYDATILYLGTAGGSATIIKNDIANNYSPVIYAASDNNSSVGHVWVVDAVRMWEHWYYEPATIVGGGQPTMVQVERIKRRGHLMHCNWGWDGDANGWYYNFQPYHGNKYHSYTYDKRIFMGIKPR